MSDDKDRSPTPQGAKNGVLSLLAKTPLVLNPDENQLAKQGESSTNDDAKKMYDSSSSRSTTPEQKVMNDSTNQRKNSDRGDFNNEEIQRKMSEVIIKSQSRPITPQKPTAVASPRKQSLSDTENADSTLTTSKTTKVVADESANQPRQNSFSLGHTSSDDTTLDDDLFNSKTTATSQEDRPASNRSKKDSLDETRRFGSVSPKPTIPSDATQPVSSRPNSRSSKNDRRSPSVHSTASASAKYDQQQRKSQTSLKSPVPDHDEKGKPANAVVLPASRQGSAVKADQKASSRPSSARKSPTNADVVERPTQQPLDQPKKEPYIDESRLPLIKPGEQLQLPKESVDNERLNSPPPSPGVVKKTVSTNPLLSQDRSRPPSEEKRRNSNTAQDTKSVKSPRGSETGPEQNKDLADQKSTSRKGSSASQQQAPPEPQKGAQEVRPTSRQSLFEQEEEKPSSKVASRKNSSTSQAKVPSRRESQQPADEKQDKKTNSSRRGSDAREKPTTEQEGRVLSSTKQPPPPPPPPRISSQQSRKSSNSKTDQNPSKSPREEKLSHTTSPAANDLTSPRDDQARPKSPTAQQISEHNLSSNVKKGNPADGKKKPAAQAPLFRSASAESFNHIPIVDDKSIDSNSGNNTEVDKQKKRVVRSKKKDMETNTESSVDEKPHFRERSQAGSHQQGSTQLQKPGKGDKAVSNQFANRRALSKEASVEIGKPTKKRTVKQSSDTDDDQDPVNVNVTVLVKNYPAEKDDQASSAENSKRKQKKPESDAHRLPKPSVEFERNTLSDTEQIMTEQQKKRRRPKRISRTTQTYERIFRMMAFEEHAELRPAGKTEKCIQTRRSQLRPPTRSPRKQQPIYLSSDAFKMEEILPKQFPHAQRNLSKTSMVARSTSPQGGKLLILRPTLPLHHTDAVNVQRICLQYAIDLIPSNAHSNGTSKSNVLQQLEKASHLPAIRASSSSSGAANQTPSHRFSTKDKSNTSRNPVRPYQQRRSDGAV